MFRPDEFSTLTPTFPAPNEPVSGYTVPNPKIVTLPSGKILSQPDRYKLLPAWSSDPDETVTAPVPGSTTEVEQRYVANNWKIINYSFGDCETTLWFSRRAMQVNRWRTRIRGKYDSGINWLSHGAGHVGGNGIGPNDRLNFALNDPTRAWMSNPTMGGCAQGSGLDNSPYKNWTSIPLHFLSDNSKLESAVIPLQWDPDGTVEGQAGVTGKGHGGDVKTAPVIHWTRKHYLKLEPHVSIGGIRQPYLHRVTAWSYYPFSWDEAQDQSIAPFCYRWGCNMHTLPSKFFTQGFMGDLQLGTKLALPGWQQPVDDFYSVHYEGSKKFLYIAYGVGGPNSGTTQVLPTTCPSGYSVVSMKADDGFSVATIAKIHDDADGGRLMTQHGAGQNTWRSNPSEWVNEVAAHNMINRQGAGHGRGWRRDGWVGHEWYIFAGMWGDLPNSLMILKGTDGLLDRPLSSNSIPNHV